MSEFEMACIGTVEDWQVSLWDLGFFLSKAFLEDPREASVLEADA